MPFALLASVFEFPILLSGIYPENVKPRLRDKEKRTWV